MKDENQTPQSAAPTDANAQTTTETPAAPAPAAPMATNPAPKKAMGKTGWIVAAVLLLLLLLGGLWWWMMYGQGTNSTTPTTPATQQNSGGSGGSNGGNGGSGGAGGSGGSSSAPIDNLSVSVKTGQTKATVEGNSGGLSPNCVTVDTGSLTTKQEVCTYSDGTKIIKVTYQGDKVVDVNRTGF